MAGYSGKPLKEKLGIKPDFNVAIISSPAGYEITGKLTNNPHNFIQIFTTSRKDLENQFPRLSGHLVPNGML